MLSYIRTDAVKVTPFHNLMRGVHNADGVNSSNAELVKKEFWHRLALLVIFYRSELVKAMNDSQIYVSPTATDNDIVNKAVDGMRDNRQLLLKVAALMRDYEKHHVA